jgi:7-cyano-7-deazaguanine synthase
MKCVVLLSGGMDSVTALYWARQQHEVVGALSFDYGSKHNHRELGYALWHCDHLSAQDGVVIPHHSMALPFINQYFSSDLLLSGGSVPDGHYAEENMVRTVVPFRNGIMLAIAAGFAESVGAEALVIAAHAGDHTIYPDCREPFMEAMAAAIAAGTYAGIQVLRPFIELDKAAIARMGVVLGVDYGQTWSCYKGGAIHCGSCGTCVERREAFLLAGIPDPTAYESLLPLPPAPVS